MRKYLLIILLILIFSKNFQIYSQVDDCSTKYPIVLVHGICYRDYIPIKKYWNKIPKYLEKNGAEVYIANVDALGTIENNASQLRKIILEIISQTGCEKVNIIAHSKGGLDARYMLSCLEMQNYVASITLISSPNRGSVWADYLIEKAEKYNAIELADKISILWANILHDSNPNPIKAYYELTTYEMGILNNFMPDAEGVYYQSYGSYITNQYPNLYLSFREKIISEYNNAGKNDGVVPVESFMWTNFKYFTENEKCSEVSHFDIIGFTNVTFFNENAFFKNIVVDLKNNGF